MTSKRSKKVQQNKSERLVFAETSKSVGEIVEKLLSSMDKFDQYKKDNLEKYDLERETMQKILEDKKKEYVSITAELETEYKTKTSNLEKEFEIKNEDLEKKYTMRNTELEKEYEVKKKDRTIYYEQYIKQYKDDAIEKFLEKEKKIAIEQEELDGLNEEIENLKSINETNLITSQKEYEEKFKKESGYAVSTLELKHQAETAELNANVNQKTNEIETLQKTISNLQKEVAAQRDLTNQIAQSMKQSPINQSFGK